jgi:hypothetical protein
METTDTCQVGCLSATTLHIAYTATSIINTNRKKRPFINCSKAIMEVTTRKKVEEGRQGADSFYTDRQKKSLFILSLAWPIGDLSINSFMIETEKQGMFPSDKYFRVNVLFIWHINFNWRPLYHAF